MSREAIRLAPPVTVMLRNKSIAVITHLVEVADFQLHGYVQAARTHIQLWKKDGHWLETSLRHDLDIVATETAPGVWTAFAGIKLAQKGGK